VLLRPPKRLTFFFLISSVEGDSHKLQAGVRMRQRQETLLFLTASIPDLGPNEPPAQSGGGGIFSRGVKWPGREADHTPPPNAKVMNGDAPFVRTYSWLGA
jgi:hypothetical protein